MPTAELTRKSALLTNFQDITGRIAAASARAGITTAKAELLAVTKYAADEDVKILIEAGAIKTAGENKVQDAKAKWVNGPLAPLKSRVKLHFIGHLQTNKAKTAVETFDWIDSIDSLKIAAEVNRHAEAAGKTMPVMIQLKLNNSATQSGVTPAQAGELPFKITTLPLVHADPVLGMRLELEGKVITYCTDTGYCPNALKLAKGADLLITECAHAPGETNPGWPHFNPETAAKLAVEAGAKRLAITHFSADRYRTPAARAAGLKLSRMIFPKAIGAKDGLIINII